MDALSTVELEFGLPERPSHLTVPHATGDAVAALAAELRARGQRLNEMTVDRVIDSIDRAVVAWQDRRHPYRDQAEEWLAKLTPYSPPALALALDHMLAELRAPRLWTLLTSELGDPAVLDTFVPAAPGDGAPSLRAYGPGLTLHVLAGNVPVVAIPSIVMALLARSPSLVKPARAEPVTAALFARTLDEIAPELAGCIAVWPWAGGDVAVEQAACAAAGAVICYGSDAAVDAIRSLTPARARFLAYRHRVSAGFIAREALTAAAAPGIAAAVARDVSLLDQQGCLSPHSVYVEEGGEVSPAAFAEALAGAMREAARELPRGAIGAASASAIQQLRGSYEFRALAATGAGDAPAAVGAAEPGPVAGAPAVYTSPRGTEWTVLYEPDPVFVPSCFNRVVRVHPVRSLREATDALRPVGDLLSAVGYAAPRDRAGEIAAAFGEIGATRVCPLGRMQNPPVLWRHDGRPRVADLLRFVTLEAN